MQNMKIELGLVNHRRKHIDFDNHKLNIAPWSTRWLRNFKVLAPQLKEAGFESMVRLLKFNKNWTIYPRARHPIPLRHLPNPESHPPSLRWQITTIIYFLFLFIPSSTTGTRPLQFRILPQPHSLVSIIFFAFHIWFLIWKLRQPHGNVLSLQIPTSTWRNCIPFSQNGLKKGDFFGGVDKNG